MHLVEQKQYALPAFIFLWLIIPNYQGAGFVYANIITFHNCFEFVFSCYLLVLSRISGSGTKLSYSHDFFVRTEMFLIAFLFVLAFAITILFVDLPMVLMGSSYEIGSYSALIHERFYGNPVTTNYLAIALKEMSKIFF